MIAENNAAKFLAEPGRRMRIRNVGRENGIRLMRDCFKRQAIAVKPDSHRIAVGCSGSRVRDYGKAVRLFMGTYFGFV